MASPPRRHRQPARRGDGRRSRRGRAGCTRSRRTTWGATRRRERGVRRAPRGPTTSRCGSTSGGRARPGRAAPASAPPPWPRRTGRAPGAGGSTYRWRAGGLARRVGAGVPHRSGSDRGAGRDRPLSDDQERHRTGRRQQEDGGRDTTGDGAASEAGDRHRAASSTRSSVSTLVARARVRCSRSGSAGRRALRLPGPTTRRRRGAGSGPVPRRRRRDSSIWVSRSVTRMPTRAVTQRACSTARGMVPSVRCGRRAGPEPAYPSR